MKLATVVLVLAIAAVALAGNKKRDSFRNVFSGKLIRSARQYRKYKATKRTYQNFSGFVTGYSAPGKTRVTLSVEGLEPNTFYPAKLYQTGCNTQEGTAVYQNDAEDFAYPPNEIWLSFTTDENGDAIAFEKRKYQIEDINSRSIIIHKYDSLEEQPKLFCVDLTPRD
eukprot:m.14145 g.14145  ORF g.14145 m.14145 type:complete len:168 (+) comp6146_c1_seq1:306-809(+)